MKRRPEAVFNTEIKPLLKFAAQTLNRDGVEALLPKSIDLSAIK